MDIGFSFGDDDSGTVQSLVDEFNQQNTSGINVIYREMPWDPDRYHERLRAMFRRGGTRIDVIAGDVIWPPEFASNGWIADLSDRLSRGQWEMFLDAPMEANTDDEGKVWGVPWHTDVGLLYYRKDLLEESGFTDPPETWDELKRIALRVQRDSGIRHGYLFQGADYEGGVCNGLEFIWTHDGDVLLDRNNQVIINNIAAKNGLRAERHMVEDGVAPQRVHTFTEEESTVRFLDGESVFCRNWPFLFGILDDEDEPLSQDVVGVAELPREQGVHQGGGCLGGWNMFINAASAHQDEAWEFIEFMTAPEQQGRLAIGASRLPTRKELYQDKQLLNDVPILRFSRRALENARPRPLHPRYSEMSEEMAEQFNLSLRAASVIEGLLGLSGLRRELFNIVGS
jgi:multiple sugar transport system substrate-binding protein